MAISYVILSRRRRRRIPPLCGGDPSLGLDTAFGLLDHQLRV